MRAFGVSAPLSDAEAADETELAPCEEDETRRQSGRLDRGTRHAGWPADGGGGGCSVPAWHTPPPLAASASAVPRGLSPGGAPDRVRGLVRSEAGPSRGAERTKASSGLWMEAADMPDAADAGELAADDQMMPPSSEAAELA